MDWTDFFGLGALAALGWFWYDGLRARELALAEAKAVCAGEGLQLLDESVALRRLGMTRDADGVLRLRRVYEFEYSPTGDSRETGSIVVVGQSVSIVKLSVLPVRGTTPTLH